MKAFPKCSRNRYERIEKIKMGHVAAKLVTVLSKILAEKS